jgi:ABC-type enterochelin transport system permease subunit
MEEWLFGNIMGLRDKDLWTNFWISFGALGVLTALHRPLLMTLFDAEVAATLGVPVRALNYLLLAVLIVVLISSLQAVGCMLAIGLLVTPAATVYLLTDSTHAMFWGGAVRWAGVVFRGAGRLVAQHRARPGDRSGARRGLRCWPSCSARNTGCCGVGGAVLVRFAALDNPRVPRLKHCR